MPNILNINPNRMELMKLGKRYKLAKRGHRLLKDKQDDLMERFTEATKKVSNLRANIEKDYESLKTEYYNFKNSSDYRALAAKKEVPPAKTQLTSNAIYLMNMVIPELEAVFEDISQDYGNMNLSALFTLFIYDFRELFGKIIKLVNAERAMFVIAEELQKVRRRVNALEYIFIPKLEETMGYISMQLEEMEREDITRLMKIKDIVRNK